MSIKTSSYIYRVLKIRIWKTIFPTTILENSTRVSVKDKRGIIVGHEILQDQFGKPITVHTIHYTHTLSHRVRRGQEFEPFDKIERVNWESKL